jgi:enoyl-CoA hydratase/carnithine racemase
MDVAMPYQAIEHRKADNVTAIIINGLVEDPEKLAQLSRELTQLCAEINDDEETRIILLTGSGEKSFTMGAELIKAVSAVDEESPKKLWSLAEPMARLDRPIIAAINGNATGPGLELALACDIRVAVETSHFGFPHIQAGLIPWDGGTQRLPRLVGKSKALEMILTGEMIDAQEAYRMGLVNKVVPPGELMKAVMDMAREVASKGPVALRYAKEAVNKGMDLTLTQGLRLEADLYFLLHTTQDRTEGITAFRERRTPKFEGR